MIKHQEINSNRLLFTVFVLTVLFATCTLLTSCIPGPKGEQGLPGETITGPAGPRGDSGDRGSDGVSVTGPAGQSCNITTNSLGALITCGITSTQVFNGTDGVNATPVTPIFLCPTLTGGVFKEYLLRINGDLFAVYASGSTTGLAKLWPGSWVTTDGRSCHFTINSNLDVVY